MKLQAPFIQLPLLFDADALARAIARLLDDGALRATMGEAAARFVDGERDLPHAAAQLSAVLASLTKP